MGEIKYWKFKSDEVYKSDKNLIDIFVVITTQAVCFETHSKFFSSIGEL